MLLAGCARAPHRQVVVLGIDGMDPKFVERHWAELPNLRALRDEGSFQRLSTTSPPQSPVAWSTFITGLDPAEHGIFDFVHRDAATKELFLSTDRTVESRFVISLGDWRLPLTASKVVQQRRGKAFWQTLSERGVPVMVLRMPTNYPPLPFGKELAGMGTPDLRGTQGTFTLFHPEDVSDNHAAFVLEGPANPLRRDRASATVTLDVDVDPELPVARFAVGDQVAVLRQGEWSGWIPVEFPLLPHLAAAHGMVRIYAKQLKPRLEVYVSPVNIDPLRPALPVANFDPGIGRFTTLGIGEDTSALRQGVFTLPEFLAQSRLVLRDEKRLLRAALDQYRDGFLFFYFSSVDQNSHILWGRHEDELLRFYQEIDAELGAVRKRLPRADLIVMSDHGFSTFDRAVNLNAYLAAQGLAGKAWAAGLNAVYVTGADRADVRQRLLDMRDPETGQVVIERVDEVRAAPRNRAVAPDLVVGYAPGYRASWATGLGETAGTIVEANQDAWLADHCISADEVPGVLFMTKGLRLDAPSLKKLSGVILGLY